MTPLRRWGVPSRWALAGALGSGVVAAVAVLGAVRLAPLPEAATRRVRVELAGPDSNVRALSQFAVLAAVSRAPFRPDRKPPSIQYVLPADRRPPAPPVPPSPFLKARLVGTVLQPGGGLAMVDLPGRGARVVAVGDSLEGFRLLRVERGAADFQSPDTLVTLRVADLRRRATP
jgi:hypothetical protein